MCFFFGHHDPVAPLKSADGRGSFLDDGGGAVRCGRRRRRLDAAVLQPQLAHLVDGHHRPHVVHGAAEFLSIKRKKKLSRRLDRTQRRVEEQKKTKDDRLSVSRKGEGDYKRANDETTFHHSQAKVRASMKWACTWFDDGARRHFFVVVDAREPTSTSLSFTVTALGGRCRVSFNDCSPEPFELDGFFLFLFLAKIWNEKSIVESFLFGHGSIVGD